MGAVIKYVEISIGGFLFDFNFGPSMMLQRKPQGRLKKGWLFTKWNKATPNIFIALLNRNSMTSLLELELVNSANSSSKSDVVLI